MRGQDVKVFPDRLVALTDNIKKSVVLLDEAKIHRTHEIRQMASLKKF